MIFTRQMISEFVDLKGISTDEIYKKLNAIGLEVDSLTTLEIPDHVVVGKVESCERHPDADKLSVCQVNVGKETKQIVCGAKNVAADLYVPVAMVGARLPNGIEIKKAELRGVASEGMICSSEELGLPKMNDGILELDGSIGKLKAGDSLQKNPYFNDDVFEIDLTPNRGDCLNVYGVARELSVAFDRMLKPINYNHNDDHTLGIGRVLQVTHEGNIDASLLYKVVDIDSFSMPLLISMRLAFTERLSRNNLENMMEYVTYSTGVVLQAYRHESFLKDPQEKKYWLYVKKDAKTNLDTVHGKKKVSTVGVKQEEDFMPETELGTLVVEASYIPPEIVSELVPKNKLEKNDALFFRTSRGTSPDLTLGIDYFCDLLNKYSEGTIYSGTHEFFHNYKREELNVNVEEVGQFIGHKIDKSKIVTILKKLGFDVEMAPDDGGVSVAPPAFRHDIANQQDVVEEIVRIYGVDNIPSQPMVFAEAYRESAGLKEYNKRRILRQKAVDQGFFETIHFLFASSESCEKYGYKGIEKKKALKNPITNELDALRPTLLINLLDSVASNIKFGRKSIGLFEVGSVYTSKREEISKMAFVYCGFEETEQLSNSGKPENIGFHAFAKKVASVIGNIELKPLEEIPSSLIHPYQSAVVVLEGQEIGYLSKLHPVAQEELELFECFVAEIDVDKIPHELKIAKSYSKFPALTRDISVVIDKAVPFSRIRESIGANSIGEIKRFYPLDIFEGEGVREGHISLTVRFEIQSDSKTLEESDINMMMETILSRLQSDVQAELR